ncbi:MAG TPA: hypothetical protein VNV88_06050, partial [Candidatus Solibacter sp.]|nr:hypothetical protein [Candidatus Solibacter sp.]
RDSVLNYSCHSGPTTCKNISGEIFFQLFPIFLLTQAEQRMVGRYHTYAKVPSRSLENVME